MSFIYNSARESFLDGSLKWVNASSDDVYVALINKNDASLSNVGVYLPVASSAHIMLSEVTTGILQVTTASGAADVLCPIVSNGSATDSILSTTDGTAGIKGASSAIVNVTEVSQGGLGSTYVGTGQQVDAILIFKYKGSSNHATSDLICYIDSGNGLDAGETNGQAIDIVWNGTGGQGDDIFTL